ncbi:hypothetical protein ES708_21170 [subsurface metagenome]
MSQTLETEKKLYEITNRTTGHKQLSVSDNAQDACEQAGWNIGDCFVVEVKPKRKAGKDGHSDLMVKIPCQTCPFQYGECLSPAEVECPVSRDTPDIHEWTKRVLEAHHCDYVGVELSKTDHQAKQKWCSMEQAIRELGDYR